MRTNRPGAPWLTAALCLVMIVAGCGAPSTTRKPADDPSAARPDTKNDPYADYIWPPPPDKGRIKLEQVITGRADIASRSGFKRKILSVTPQTIYDTFHRPFAVEFDSQGRILVVDTETRALLRFDREGRRMDVFGTSGPQAFQYPIGLHVAPDDTIYVADSGAKRVIALDGKGAVQGVYGRAGDLINPVDSVTSPDGATLLVSDSKAHQIVVFDLESGDVVSRFGRGGDDDGEFNHPSALAFTPDGNLLVLDQMNARVQMFDDQHNFLDLFGGRGTGPGNFVRPKDIAVDEVGFIYVTDYDFNNLQLFDADFTILTFLGRFGTEPGTFYGVAGVAVRGPEIAVVDQFGARLQLFRFIVPKED